MPNETQHKRAQNTLLINKLLDCRDNASPFTLILDSLEQPAKPLIIEYIKRAKNTKSQVTFISFQTFNPPNGVDHFVRAYELPFDSLHETIKSETSPPSRKNLLILDTLHPLLSSPSLNPSTYLSAFLTLHPPTTTQTTLLSIYHLDEPISPPPTPYTPHPLSLLKYMATTILTLQPLSHVLAAKSARNKSLAAPVFGLRTGAEGVLQEARPRNSEKEVVVEVESRRKSGREVVLAFVLGGPGKGVRLLQDHPAFAALSGDTGDVRQEESPESTFSLGLTEKQRKDREGVVLPYFDAQREGEDGVGEGGRILYEMGEEDDFDEEEDEI